MNKVLITGVTGFAGSFLAEHLLEKGEYQIHGTFLTESSHANISKVKDSITLHKLDLNSTQDTEDLIFNEKFDYIYHLAALASAGESFKNPKEYLTNNISASLNILEGIRKSNIATRVLLISSAEVYGNVRKEDLPIDEGKALRPVSPYAVSKVSQDFLGQQYFLSYNIPVITVRPFNHVGPRQSPQFAVPSFASKIARIEAGHEAVLKVGNLSAKRDLSDVRDIVRGYSILMEKGVAGEIYNIGSGISYKIEDILNKLISIANTEIKIEIDESLFRPIDVEEFVCDNKKIVEATGWKPEISIDRTLKDTLDYWRGIT